MLVIVAPLTSPLSQSTGRQRLRSNLGLCLVCFAVLSLVFSAQQSPGVPSLALVSFLGFFAFVRAFSPSASVAYGPLRLCFCSPPWVLILGLVAVLRPRPARLPLPPARLRNLVLSLLSGSVPPRRFMIFRRIPPLWKLTLRLRLRPLLRCLWALVFLLSRLLRRFLLLPLLALPLPLPPLQVSLTRPLPAALLRRRLFRSTNPRPAPPPPLRPNRLPPRRRNQGPRG